MATTANSTTAAADGGISVTPTITLTGGDRYGLLGPIEGPIYELQTRLDFLAEHFAHENGYENMGHRMLHLLLTDCRALADAAREAYEAAWTMTGGATA